MRLKRSLASSSYVSIGTKSNSKQGNNCLALLPGFYDDHYSFSTKSNWKLCGNKSLFMKNFRVSRNKNDTGFHFLLPALWKASMAILWLTPATIGFESGVASGAGSYRSASGFVGRERSFSSWSAAKLQFQNRETSGRIRTLLLRKNQRWFSSGWILKAKDRDANDDSKEDVPLVFLHGMKGSHLAFRTSETTGETKSQRSWLSLGGLLNFPPREDGHPERDISLPLTYKKNSKDSSFPVQDKGKHFVDGTVDHVIELSGMLPGNVAENYPWSNTGNLDFFPFYGHATKFLEEVNDAYVLGDEYSGTGNNGKNSDGAERTVESIMKPRPTRSFCYDWRRNLFELADEFHAFCEREFPNGQPVQIVAHSMGGLIAYAAMKEHPAKYAPGGVLVGVPFGTGIQYFQDLHKGYFTELGTCRQFLPPAQFTFSSHWSFFPISKDEIEDSFVDVSEYFDANNNSDTIAFEADRSTIGKKTSANDEEEDDWRPATPGKAIEIDFYNVEEWEKNEIGIFNPSYRHIIDATDKNQISEYKEHMKLQIEDAKRWRTTVMAPWEDEKTAKSHLPPLTICSSVSIPTPNQILRRKRQTAPKTSPISNKKIYESFPRSLISLLEKGDGRDVPTCQWEYDYASGRTVPGDGRIDYDKSFPPSGTSFSTVDLSSLHAKQFCWEETGGDLGTVFKEVNQQIQEYHEEKWETKTGNSEASSILQQQN